MVYSIEDFIQQEDIIIASHLEFILSLQMDVWGYWMAPRFVKMAIWTSRTKGGRMIEVKKLNTGKILTQPREPPLELHLDLRHRAPKIHWNIMDDSPEDAEGARLPEHLR
ncbi:hypothetical protein M407DRAFT_31596 [Tulasnella calospora MUT 4182]|uniref:Uncharacterized protein n=1 Tax=Tulasnella calospora MUT 4182 TaxID=1051891 RepID=A0A0C3LB43_9AGAM|nr:hypothetical protein M407DRAFT_31596 [Tulasnella calospora MUT 4182]